VALAPEIRIDEEIERIRVLNQQYDDDTDRTIYRTPVRTEFAVTPSGGWA
jgi:hypothetical protein